MTSVSFSVIFVKLKEAQRTLFVRNGWRVLFWGSLALGTLLAPLPWAVSTSVVLVGNFASALFTIPPQGKLALGLLTLYLPAAVWYVLAGAWGASLWSLLALPVIDYALRVSAPMFLLAGAAEKPPVGRKATALMQTLAVTLALVVFLGALSSNSGLTLASAILAAYLLSLLYRIGRAVPEQPVTAERASARVMAGDTVNTRVTLASTSRLPLYFLLPSDASGARVRPSQFSLDEGEELSVTVTFLTSLAGPDMVSLPVVALDPWGLLYTGQTISAAEITVVPRAAVSAWLARQFLLGAEAAAGPSQAQTARPGLFARRDEYVRHRLYVPGDAPRDIDWRRTSKFRELVVKEFSGGASQVAALLVNLEAENAEEADRLAWDLIAHALTLAQESIPTAVAAFGGDGLLSRPPSNDPKALVRWSMQLLSKISYTSHGARVLGVPDVPWLRQALRDGRDEGEVGGGTQSLLKLELGSLEHAYEMHQLARAVEGITRQLSRATVLILSRSPKEGDVLAVGKDKLEKAGHRVLVADEPTASPRKYWADRGL